MAEKHQPSLVLRRRPCHAFDGFPPSTRIHLRLLEIDPRSSPPEKVRRRNQLKQRIVLPGAGSHFAPHVNAKITGRLESQRCAAIVHNQPGVALLQDLLEFRIHQENFPLHLHSFFQCLQRLFLGLLELTRNYIRPCSRDAARERIFDQGSVGFRGLAFFTELPRGDPAVCVEEGRIVTQWFPVDNSIQFLHQPFGG
ncbi:MAG: hypothetical protein JW395_0357 [Nitrospira sp.]|nr:hypothetical protein [Nitrospira sp.]